MSNESYSQQLRSDSFATVVPAISGLVFVLSFIGIVFFPPNSFLGLALQWVIVFTSPLTAYYALRLANRDREPLAGAIYVGVHLVLITGVYWQFWSPTSPVPYFFAVFIIMSSMFINLYASFWTWLASAIFMLAVLPFVEAIEFTQALPILLPIAFNFIVASISFLSAIDWQIALESTSELHLKVQQRRDELFNIQEELSLTNAKLNSVNRELDKATS